LAVEVVVLLSVALEQDLMETLEALVEVVLEEMLDKEAQR
jgi:hypothetical protein